MSDVQDHLLRYWPIILASLGGLAAAIASIRYRIPDLVKRVEKMEAKNHPTPQDHENLVKRIETMESESSKHPSNKDLEKAVTSFHTICKFNQVTCQKGTEQAIHQVRQDSLDKEGGEARPIKYVAPDYKKPEMAGLSEDEWGHE